MDSKLTAYHIGDLSNLLGISSRTLRYYEEIGLVHPTRTEGGFRVYTENDVDLLKFIIRFKDLGLSLDEIRTLVAPRGAASSEKRIEELKVALLTRRAEFEEKIAMLRQGIEQIDDVVRQLNRCVRCGEIGEKDVCDRCLTRRGEAVSPLLDPIR